MQIDTENLPPKREIPNINECAFKRSLKGDGTIKTISIDKFLENPPEIINIAQPEILK